MDTARHLDFLCSAFAAVLAAFVGADVAPAFEDSAMPLALVLRHGVEGKLSAAALNVSDPHHPSYGHHLTNAEIDAARKVIQAADAKKMNSIKQGERLV